MGPGGADAGAGGRGAPAAGRTVDQLREALPESFPLAKEIGVQKARALLLLLPPVLNPHPHSTLPRSEGLSPLSTDRSLSVR
jgi:hypothetical protein